LLKIVDCSRAAAFLADFTETCGGFSQNLSNLSQWVPLQQKLAAMTSLKVVFAHMKIAADRMFGSTNSG